MNDETACITNSMRDAYPCLTEGAHRPECDLDGCTGCEPRAATHGKLCSACWFALEQALTDWEAFSAMLRGVDRAVSPEGGARPQLGPRLPLSPLDLDFDAIWSAQKSRGNLPTYLWVATDAGAMDAVRFTRTVAAAITRHPTMEHPRRLEHARCPNCRMRALVYTPTAIPNGDAIVKCLRCGLTQDYTAFQRLALIEAQCCRHCRPTDEDGGCSDHDCTCHRFAPVPVWQRTSKATEEEPYDPRLPENADLEPLGLLTVRELRILALALNVEKYRSMRKPELITAIKEAA